MAWWYLIPAAVLAYRAIEKASRNSAAFRPEKSIAIIGRTSSGKSLLGNDLLGDDVFDVGSTHGTTTYEELERLPGTNWMVADTPGLLDGKELAVRALSRAAKSLLTIFVCDGIPYQQELDTLCGIISNAPTDFPRAIIVCMNKKDAVLDYVPSDDRKEIVASVIGFTNILEQYAEDTQCRVVGPIFTHMSDREELFSIIDDLIDDLEEIYS